MSGAGSLPSNTGDPAWKRELLKRPLVEVRRGFSVGYDAPSEDSSTIVLTAPSGKFVDIRFSTLPEAGSDSQVKQQVGKIHGYATAGMSTTSFPSAENSNCPPYDFHMHMRWKHDIDSSNDFGTDGADIILLADGARMEVGFMEIRGVAKYFKEYWIVPPGRATETPCVVAELDTSKTTDYAGPIRTAGIAMRIGDFCQAILQTADDFWYERWEYIQGKGWLKNTRSNTPKVETLDFEVLPCMWLVGDALQEGESMSFTSGVWFITESIY